VVLSLMSVTFWISIEKLLLVFAFKYFERINANYLIVLLEEKMKGLMEDYDWIN
jgi:hypothetical protein